MNLRSVILLYTLLTAVLGLQTLAKAEQVTQNVYEDSFPHISGNYMAWQGYVDGDWEIFVYDIAAGGPPVQVTNNDYDDISPQTDGSYVVWLGESASGGDIFLYDISSGGPPTQITTDNNVDSSPQIANGRVVWTSHQVTTSVEPGEIFLYDILGLPPKTKQLTYNTLDDSSPRINHESAIWLQSDAAGNTTIMIYNLAADETNTAPEAFVWEDGPQTDGSLMVFTKHDGLDREIFIRNVQLNTCDPITRNSIQDRYPCISGDYVAWVGGEGKAAEIYLSGQGDDSMSAWPVVDKVRGNKEPGRIVRIIGQAFGQSQGDSVVHIGPKEFGPGHRRIIYWSDTKVRVRLPKYRCNWFKGKDFRRVKVWLTVGGVDSNERMLKVFKPATCP
jgi:beta propeller repeat protein